ncbi:MAG TPA: sigma-54 dependent transcriptional regulator [Bdellovibrionota bacterium]|nr:sigma-54 dependent transcriptional regulator [Bdellovibrionota bacterium]
MNRTILGGSPSIKELLNLIRRVAASKTNILVTGESGTGKELVARMIHDAGPLKNGPFVPINCGAIPENLIESELFGHRRGSFTGAVNEKIGLFETANDGTLFLDEVGELPLPMQVKLLRAIQERVFRKVGGTDDIHVDVRIIAATNRDLEVSVAKGLFREDLYYRLNVILIKTPPLRERKGDVELLADHFLKKFGGRFNKNFTGIDPEVILALEAYDWPGNVRELENVIERAVTLENNSRITLESLPSALRNTARTRIAIEIGSGNGKPGAHAGEIRLPAPDFSKGPIQLDKILSDVERAYLTQALNHTRGVKRKAAEALGITFRSIRYRLTKLGVDPGTNDDEEES